MTKKINLLLLMGCLVSKNTRSMDQDSKGAEITQKVASLNINAVPAAPSVEDPSVLYNACKNGDLDKVKNHVALFPDRVHYKYADGLTPLHGACIGGHDKIVEFLLGQGASVTTKDNNGFTALHVTCQQGSLTIARYLIEHGAVINDQENFLTHTEPETNSESRSQRGVPMESVLNEDGTQRKVVQIARLSPLHLASRNGHETLVDFLIKQGADVNACTNHDQTPLHLACLYKQKAVIACLLQHDARVNVPTKGEKITPLHWAVELCDRETVAWLIEHGANVDSADYSGYTALHRAVDARRRDIVELLVENGADIHYRASNNATPLYIAVHNGFEELAACLLNKNTPLISVDDSAGLLYTAMAKDNVSMIKVLLVGGIIPPLSTSASLQHASTSSATTSASASCHEERSLITLLKTLRETHDTGFMPSIALKIAQQTSLNAQDFQLLAQHVPLHVQQAVMNFWQHDSTQTYRNKQYLLLQAHCNLRFAYLKKVMAKKGVTLPINAFPDKKQFTRLIQEGRFGHMIGCKPTEQQIDFFYAFLSKQKPSQAPGRDTSTLLDMAQRLYANRVISHDIVTLMQGINNAQDFNALEKNLRNAIIDMVTSNLIPQAPVTDKNIA